MDTVAADHHGKKEASNAQNERNKKKRRRGLNVQEEEGGDAEEDEGQVVLVRVRLGLGSGSGSGYTLHSTVQTAIRDMQCRCLRSHRRVEGPLQTRLLVRH